MTIASFAQKYTLDIASRQERETIYALRHQIYSEELGQHQPNDARRLSDNLDENNIYIVARDGETIAGFVSITPPCAGRYSIDKYFERDTMPFEFDRGLCEVRLLSVVGEHRSGPLAMVLMYATFRWAQEHGGTRIVAIGRREILELYRKAGLQSLGRQVRSGAVTYELLSETIVRLSRTIGAYRRELDRIRRRIDWRLPFGFEERQACFHGGAFFEAVGEEFDDLDRHHTIINADVLDAWYPPAPRVMEELQKHLPWLIRTSPPTGCAGMATAIARKRAVDARSILPGAGSSDLIFLALRELLTGDSKVLILDPTYGEYPYILEQVIGCQVERFRLRREDGYAIDSRRLKETVEKTRYDMVILINPNSPTGRFVSRDELAKLVTTLSKKTLLWIDETYIEYVGAEHSLERVAAASSTIIVCKSMSKVYALSGLRSAYLCAHPQLIKALRKISPPWAVSLPAQVAAVAALEEEAYYKARYEETHILRDELGRQLRERFSFDGIPGTANFLLFHLPEIGPSAARIVDACKKKRLYLRDAGTMGTAMGSHALRIAVKDRETNIKMIKILGEVLADLPVCCG
ncbi:MAG: histidinol-phosphate transaminase [Candidatus Omnitrophota bacterium]